jgi:hypothetical protein
MADSERKYKNAVYQKIVHQNIDLSKKDDIQPIYQKVGLPDKDLALGVYALQYNIRSGRRSYYSYLGERNYNDYL